MTNEEFISYATEKWIGLFKKKTKLTPSDLRLMEDCITNIIRSTIEWKESEMVKQQKDNNKTSPENKNDEKYQQYLYEKTILEVYRRKPIDTTFEEWCRIKGDKKELWLK